MNHTSENDKDNIVNDISVAMTVEFASDRALGTFGPYIFDEILVDPSNVFNPVLGTFTCPDNDLYVFYWTILATEGRVAASLRKDGEEIKYGPLTSEIPGSHSGSSTMSAIVLCNIGSKIWLQSASWPDDLTCNKAAEAYTSLTAFKIFKSIDRDAAAFTAQLSTNSSLVDDIAFDDELIDIGGNYDPTSGFFTCPQDGIYVFTVSVHFTSSSGNVDFGLMQNGVEIYELFYVLNTFSTSEDSGTSTITRLVDCKTGDVINVYRSSSSSYMAIVSSFTGYMLNTTDAVAFHAELSTTGDYGNNERIIFDKVSVNKGNHYNPTTGIFTCPDDGMYFLSWAVVIGSESSQRSGEARLVMGTRSAKSGPLTSRVFSGSTSSTSSTQCIVQCEQGTTLSISAVVSDSNSMSYTKDFCNFVAFRVPKL